MVAAHPWDLRAAALGMRTAFVGRAGEGVPEPSDTFDFTARGLADLAALLVPGPGLTPAGQSGRPGSRS
jgi:hypothetical protein